MDFLKSWIIIILVYAAIFKPGKYMYCFGLQLQTKTSLKATCLNVTITYFILF